MNLLFVCSRNRLRSPTAEAIFAGTDGVQVMSAGTSPDAETTLSADLIEWADLIFVMEAVHKRRIADRFPLAATKKIVTLRIPDKYTYMQIELVALLEKRVGPYLRP